MVSFALAGKAKTVFLLIRLMLNVEELKQKVEPQQIESLPQLAGSNGVQCLAEMGD